MPGNKPGFSYKNKQKLQYLILIHLLYNSKLCKSMSIMLKSFAICFIINIYLSGILFWCHFYKGFNFGRDSILDNFENCNIDPCFMDSPELYRISILVDNRSDVDLWGSYPPRCYSLQIV